MKRLLRIAVLASSLAPPLAALSGGGAGAPQNRLSEKAPSFTLTDLTGKRISLSDLQGNLVVMHFAASW